ncbi:MAG: hypothetical protein ACD_43C00115G0003 [uncultured bacterium]|nr:MAG: hypothetical protein ACD_43C00115G0003 [uncultured bacterium]
MFPAKLLNSIFPKSLLATHCSVNRLAYQSLKDAAPNLHLPHLQTINYFEGMNGVDGLWLNNRQLPSRSTYNPITEQGSGLEEFEYQLQALGHAHSLRKYLRTARRMAYVSHLVTDLCTPPHQHGHLVDIRRKRWYWFWNIRDDWYEKHVERYAVDRHTLFEMKALWHLPQSGFTPLPLQVDIIAAAKTEPNYIPTAVDHMRNSVRYIRGLNIYYEYIKQGWTDTVQQKMLNDVMPRIVSSVATFWYLALR